MTTTLAPLVEDVVLRDGSTLRLRPPTADDEGALRREAARLAANDMQAEPARRQAATIRQMQREGIERGGYGGVLAWAKNFGKRRSSQPRQPALAVSE